MSGFYIFLELYIFLEYSFLDILLLIYVRLK